MAGYTPTVTAVIVSYNTADLMIKCIESLLASQGVQLSLVVVDNASTDNTLPRLARKYGLRRSGRNWRGEQDGVKIECVGLTENVGFGAANNIGSTLSTSEYLVFVNSDATVRSTTLATLVRALRKDATLGVVAPHLYWPDGSLQPQGGALPTLGNIFAWITFIDDVPGLRRFFSRYQLGNVGWKRVPKQTVAKIGWVAGTVCAVRRSEFVSLGGFDAAIFMYGEDVELCERYSQAGLLAAVVPAGKVIHLGSASSGSKNALLGELKGLLTFWQKHRPGEFRWLKRLLRVGLAIRIVIFGILRQYGRQRIYSEALELV